MLKKVLAVLGTIALAVAILIVSVLRTAAVKYPFSPTPLVYPSNLEGLSETTEEIKIDYQLAYPGPILPDSPLWGLKAARDAVWYVITTNADKKAELNLLFADKRLGSAKILLTRGKVGLAVSTTTKAEKYLFKAWQKADENRRNGSQNTEFIKRLAQAALVHRLIIKEMLQASPEEVHPTLLQTEGLAKEVYQAAAETLAAAQITPPKSPFSDN